MRPARVIKPGRAQSLADQLAAIKHCTADIAAAIPIIDRQRASIAGSRAPVAVDDITKSALRAAAKSLAALREAVRVMANYLAQAAGRAAYAALRHPVIPVTTRDLVAVLDALQLQRYPVLGYPWPCSESRMAVLKMVQPR